MADSRILPPDWDPRAAADRVLAGLINVSAPQVRGAHDAEFCVAGGRAYIVAEANDQRAGEAAAWPFVYCVLTVVDLATLRVELTLPFAHGEQLFDNATLPPGACFVPRVLALDDRRLRCYFASEQPGVRQSQTWYRDFDTQRMAFDDTIHPVRLRTAAGIRPMEPCWFHADAVASPGGFGWPAVDFGLYIFDSFRQFEGQTYVALNNYPGAQNALARLNDAHDTFELVGHYNQPANLHLTESAVNRLPDGTWLAVCRQEGGDRNYRFTTSADGRNWTAGEPWASVPSGSSSKPTLECFDGVYHLGWQDSAMVGGVGRSVFNIDVSRDARHWERKYRFETTKSFQYPTFHAYDGVVWLTVTHGDSDPSRKERIMFGQLERLVPA
ncbi:MAG: exo-alpha-sialidase [Armatimonadetes bacterium]|nr:exo-alpha-sialidase [Armatimonadota bacterium]